MPSKDKLPPINTREDVAKYQALSEEKKLNFKKCDHSDLSYEKQSLRCNKCGASWGGPRLDELYKLLTERNKNA